MIPKVFRNKSALVQSNINLLPHPSCHGSMPLANGDHQLFGHAGAE